MTWPASRIWESDQPLPPPPASQTMHSKDGREIRDHALGHAVWIGPELGEFDDDDTAKVDRIIAIAKRFERYISEGI